MHGDQFDQVVRCSRLMLLAGEHGLLLWLNRWFNALRRLRGRPYWSLAAWIKSRLGKARTFIRRFELAADVRPEPDVLPASFPMISRILEDRPGGRLVTSVWDYGGRINPFVKSVFEQETFVIGGQYLSLDFIEKEILLGPEYQARGWKDARVCFAVNCASVGCPPLRRQIYTSENLQAMLAENTRRVLNTSYHLQIRGEPCTSASCSGGTKRIFPGRKGRPVISFCAGQVTMYGHRYRR